MICYKIVYFSIVSCLRWQLRFCNKKLFDTNWLSSRHLPKQEFSNGEQCFFSLSDTLTPQHFFICLQIPQIPKTLCCFKMSPTTFVSLAKRLSTISTIISRLSIFFLFAVLVYTYVTLSLICSRVFNTHIPTTLVCKTLYMSFHVSNCSMYYCKQWEHEII